LRTDRQTPGRHGHPEHRQQTLTILQNLTNLAKALGERPGRRAIILVSEGLYGDEEVRRDVMAFGEALERARVVLYAVHLDFPFMEASVRSNARLTRTLDDRYGFDAMADTAVAAGGEAIRAISRATPAIKRIDTALSGSYVLAFERTAGDADGKRLGIKVKVSRPGADVRTRTHVTINPKG
jgi:VWFA-related protein